MNEKLIFDTELYDLVFEDMIPSAKKYIWLATANLKNLHIKKFKRARSFLYLLHDKINQHVRIRILHASLPSQNFLKEMEKFESDIGAGLELFCCPRNHMKAVIVDGEKMYLGSANLTGAGLGLKSKDKRNFELGLYSENPDIINPVSQYFDKIWMGSFCPTCKRRDICPDPL